MSTLGAAQTLPIGWMVHFRDVEQGCITEAVIVIMKIYLYDHLGSSWRWYTTICEIY